MDRLVDQGVATLETILTTAEAPALLALAAAVAVGLLVGTPAPRIQSHDLGIVTLGLALAFTNWVTNAQVAGGAEGPGFPESGRGGVAAPS